MKYHLQWLPVNSTWHIVVQQSIVAGCDITCLKTQHAGVQGKRISSSRTTWDEHSETLFWGKNFFIIDSSMEIRCNNVVIWSKLFSIFALGQFPTIICGLLLLF